MTERGIGVGLPVPLPPHPARLRTKRTTKYSQKFLIGRPSACTHLLTRSFSCDFIQEDGTAKDTVKQSSTKVGTYAYVNPVVAVVLGYFLGAEELGLRTILGTLFVLVSVVVITTTKRG